MRPLAEAAPVATIPAPAEAAPAEAIPAPGRSGSCRNVPAPPKRLLPNSHSSRAGQIPPFRVARSRTGKVPTVGLQSGADLRGARGIRWFLSVPAGKGSPVHGGPLARSRTPRRLRGSGYSETCQNNPWSLVHEGPLARSRTPRRLRGGGYSERASISRGDLFTGEAGQKPHAQAATGRRVF